MSKNQKRYLKASVRQHIFDNGSYILNISVLLDDLKACAANEKGYIKIVCGERREVDEYGNSHWLAEDLWQKEQNEKAKKGEAKAEKKPKKAEKKETAKEEVDEDDDDLPF